MRNWIEAALTGCCVIWMEGVIGADVILVKNGQARAAIHVSETVMSPESKGHQRLRDSVTDLARCLEKMSGAKIAVNQRPPGPDDKLLPMLVGDLATKVFGPPAEKSPYQQAWRLVVSKKGVGFIGESDEAVSYAIYELLDELGCRWYLPSDLGEVIPEATTIALPATDKSGIPATIARNIWYCDEPFRRRNRLGGIPYCAAHALEGWLTKEQLEKHLDWNAEFGGKRSVNGRICWGNAEAAQAAADNIIAYLDKNPGAPISLSPGDGVSFCECAKCKALDTSDIDTSMQCTSISDRLVHFCNQIAERVVQKHPDVVFGMLAYVQYTRPPLRQKVHPNIIPQIAPITYCRAHSMADPNCPSRLQLRKILEGWAKVCPRLAFYEYGYNLAEVSAPNPMITKWSGDLPILFRNNVKLWTPETMPNFESVLPGLYLGIRMSWYTTANPKDILDEFFARFYGAAAEPCKRYWTILDNAWTMPEHTGCGFGYGRRFTPEVMKAAREALDDALAACKTAMEYRRVKMAEESFREFELFMKLRRDLFDGHLAGLEADANRWMAVWDLRMEEYRAQSAFSPYGNTYFQEFFLPAYKDGARIARDCIVLSPSLRQWRYAVDSEKKGEILGWTKAEFDDRDWKVTDPCVETWGGLGLEDFYGPLYYRTKVRLPSLPAGKKTYLWISSTDGGLRVFVNGQLVPYVDAKGQTVPEFWGYCNPFSLDISQAAKPNAENQITIVAVRGRYLNELGTGGLLGPVLLYGEKP